MNFRIMPEPRQCGDCTFCCKTLGVPELAKAPQQRCVHCERGAGCTIYDDRPVSCREFSCLWLLGALPEALKPNRVNACLTISDKDMIVVHLDERVDPVADRKGALGRWLEATQMPIVRVTGKNRTLIVQVPNGAQK